MDKRLIALGAKYELARRRFFYYAQLKNPDFYKPERTYLVELCDTLENFLKSDKRILVINIPPRHGKSYTASNFVEWALGQNNKLQIMIGAYNETLSTRFSKQVRDTIQSVKTSPYIPVFSDVFPDTKIKRGDGAMNLWSLEGQHSSYLATSPGGTATGFGCRLLIIDDIIKSAEEAYNENIKEQHWAWFTNTMLSRLEAGGKIILIMTRWASDDLAGKALAYFPADKTLHINAQAVQADGSMLCEDVLPAAECEEKKKLMGLDIWSANYQQEPIDIKGRLYSSFKTYSGELPRFKQVRSYTDTADEGADYLCCIVYGVTFANEAYVLDVLYTDAPMELTELDTARMLHENKVNMAKIESNNGGRGFARSVRRILADNYGSNQCVVKWFHQAKNKTARILSNATWVMAHVYYPENWKDRWPEYYEAMSKYQREGKNKHDDACFVEGTMIATLFGDKPIEKIKIGDFVITPFGIRKVLWSGVTGEKEVITRIGLTGTRNHKVFSKIKGFIPLDTFTGNSENDKLSLKGLLQWKYKKLLLSMELNTDLWGRENIILVNQLQMKDGAMLKDFMSQFGNFIITRKFLMATKFITEMVILLIMTLVIWNVYQLSNMFATISRKIVMGLGVFKRLAGLQQKNGIGVQKGENGIESRARKLPKSKRTLLKFVKNVAKNLLPSVILQNFVLTPAVSAGEGNIGESRLKEFALYAEKNLREQNINLQVKSPLHVQKPAPINLTTSIEKKKVYNLTVDKDHVYYAHGLLVSNCDATTGIAEDLAGNNGIRILR